MSYKNPEAVLVIIFLEGTKDILLLQRKDDPSFWQSVTGSLEQDESPHLTAIREVKEETGIDINAENLTLIDCQKSTEFAIFPQYRHRYAPHITHVKEHIFLLPLPQKCSLLLTEHTAYQWLSPQQAIKQTKSWNNALAIEEFVK